MPDQSVVEPSAEGRKFQLGTKGWLVTLPLMIFVQSFAIWGTTAYLTGVLSPEPTDKYYIEQVILICCAFVITAAAPLFTLSIIRLLRNHRCMFEITPDGVIDHMASDKLVPWEAITNVRSRSIHRTTVLIFDLVQSPFEETNRSIFAKLINRQITKKGSIEMSVNIDPLRGKNDDIIIFATAMFLAKHNLSARESSANTISAEQN